MVGMQFCALRCVTVGRSIVTLAVRRMTVSNGQLICLCLLSLLTSKQGFDDLWCV